MPVPPFTSSVVTNTPVVELVEPTEIVAVLPAFEAVGLMTRTPSGTNPAGRVRPVRVFEVSDRVTWAVNTTDLRPPAKVASTRLAMGRFSFP